MIWVLAGVVFLLLVIAAFCVFMGAGDAIAEQDDRTYGTRRY